MVDLRGLRLEQRLGGGGSAVVYRATTAAGRTVAVKVCGSGTSVAEVDREAALGRRLAHPHLLPVLGVEDAPDGPRLVTAWAERGSLADLVRRRGGLSEGETVTVAVALATALQVT